MTDGLVRIHLPPALRNAGRWRVVAGGRHGGPDAALPAPPGSCAVRVSGTGFLYGRAFQVELALEVRVETGRTTTLRLPAPILP